MNSTVENTTCTIHYCRGQDSSVHIYGTVEETTYTVLYMYCTVEYTTCIHVCRAQSTTFLIQYSNGEYR